MDYGPRTQSRKPLQRHTGPDAPTSAADSGNDTRRRGNGPSVHTLIAGASGIGFGHSPTLEHTPMSITMTPGIGSVGNLTPTTSLPIARMDGECRYRVVLATAASFGTLYHHIVVWADSHAKANSVAKAQTCKAVGTRDWHVERSVKIT